MEKRNENKKYRTSAESRRWQYDNPGVQPQELLTLGYDNLRSALALSEHEHQNAFEFVFVEKGWAAWEIGGERIDTRAGDVFHTRPGERHRGSYDVIEPCRFWWLILRDPRCLSLVPKDGDARWLNLSEDEMAQIADRLWGLPRVVTTNLVVVNQFRRLKTALENQSALSVLESRAAILDFLLLLFRPESTSGVGDEIASSLQQLIKHLSEQLYLRPTVPELAQQIGVSPSYLYRIFREYTGMPPMAYCERLRIEAACTMLAETRHSITQVALDLGYASSQHFATAFRRVIGRSPTDWRSRFQHDEDV